MNPAQIPNATRVLGAPEGWDPKRDGECGALHVKDNRVNDVRFMQSEWEPTPEERAAIAAGANVRLTVWGITHPPVALEVYAP